MALQSGSRLGAHEIVSLVGEGGMGRVYRARDTKLGRDVAIKVLPSELAQDRERLARFEREAKLLASLNHPNIAQIFGVFEEDQPAHVHALVMELVEGEDLSQVISRGAIPLADALPIARQIAEALEAAHEQGIVHRDLKPANVKVRADGTVKVLDFGLAKALEPSGPRQARPPAATDAELVEASPTMTARASQMGMIIGTAAYMSPEQAKGRAVDKRADIWAFGVVVFEMLTGQRLFAGETVSDTLAAVLREEVPWNRLPPETPGSLVRLLHRCLNREPKRRLHSAADARIEIEDVVAGSEAPSNRRRMETSATNRGPWILVGFLALSLVGLLFRGLMAPTPETRMDRLKVELAPDEPLATALGANAVLSPDGRSVVLVNATRGDGTRLSVRRLDQLDAAPLSGTEDARSPFFSPDGRWIGFETPTGLMKVGVGGGAPVTLADVGANPGRGATWSGKQIVFARINTGLFRISDSGGEPTPLTALDAAHSERSHRWPSFLPGGKAVLFMVQHSGQAYDDADIEAVSLDSGKRTVLVRGGAFPRFATGGYLLFVRDRVLYSLRFDPERLTVEEPATPVLESLMGYTDDEATGDGSAEISLSERGDLLYRSSGGGDSREGTDLVWLDEEGQEAPAFHESIRVGSVELSPEGGRIAYDGRSARGPGIFIRDIERGTLTPLSRDGAGERSPAWSPDGNRLAYTKRSGEERLMIRAMAGGAELEVSAAGASANVGPTSWLPDSSAVVATRFSPSTLNDVVLFPLNRDKPKPLISLPGTEEYGRVSPNGRWLAYQSDEKGQTQAFVTSLVQPGLRLQVPGRGGRTPRWSRDGRRLYFVETANSNVPGLLASVSVSQEGESLRFGPPRQVSSLLIWSTRQNYDVHPDGRILAIKRPQNNFLQADSAHAVLVRGWREELERRMSGEK